MFKNKTAIIIPTKDRRDDLKRLLESIARQDIKPAQTIVVDGSDNPVKDVLETFPGLSIDYIRLTPPSLTVQRNMGIRSLKDEITLVVFLDDDVVLEEGALYNMMRFWDSASQDTAGAGFNLTNIPYEKSNFFERLFLVTPEKPGTVLRSGFQSKNHFVNKNENVKWLSGGTMVWRRDIFSEYSFDEWFSGYAHCEDLDFSYRVGRKYKLYIIASSRAKHFSERLDNSENKEFSFALGKMQVLNRVYLAKKNADFSVLLSYWACFGMFLNNIAKGLLSGNKRYLLRVKGNIAGFLASFYLNPEKSVKLKRWKEC